MIKKLLIIWQSLIVVSCYQSPFQTKGQRWGMVTVMYKHLPVEVHQVETIKVEELKAKLKEKNDDYVLVDVRDPEEQAVSLIPGAIPVQKFEREKFKNKKIITYCTIGYRSGFFALELKKQGHDVRNLYGGVLAWAHAGENFVHDGKEVKKLHVYGKRWELAPSEYEVSY